MKNQFYRLLFLLVILTACKTDKAADAAATVQAAAESVAVSTQDFTILPGEGLGALNDEVSQEDMERLFGAENIKKHDYYLGEGETAPGLLLYPDEASEISVLLDDDGYPLVYRIEKENSSWATKDGIKVGSTLEDVVAANGGHFKFAGFEWDYQGIVLDWQDGKLDNSGFGIVFDYTADNTMPAEDRDELLGDISISSDNPILYKYKLQVAAITQSY